MNRTSIYFQMKKIFLFVLFPLLGLAQQDQAALLRQFFNGQHDYYHFNGNVLIAKAGKTIYQQSLGFADFNSKRPLNENSVFELASVSKQFTAMGILICKERGLLSLEDDIKILPALALCRDYSATFIDAYIRPTCI